MTSQKRIPDEVPYHGPKERPMGPYIAFMIFEFWLTLAGVVLLFWSPIWGGIVLGVALVLFILASIFGS